MAAIFYTSPINNQTIFKNGMSINNSLSLPFMNNILGGSGMLIITEVTMQHRETVQYFLTFDDFISYYYFGRGLGSSPPSVAEANANRDRGVDNSSSAALLHGRGGHEYKYYNNEVIYVCDDDKAMAHPARELVSCPDQASAGC